MSDPTKQLRNQLDMAKMVKLSDWLDQHADWLKKEGPAYNDVAAKASQELRFFITGNNVSAMNEAKGGLYKTKRSDAITAVKDKTVALVAELIAPMEQRIKELEEKVLRLLMADAEKRATCMPKTRPEDIRAANKVG